MSESKTHEVEIRLFKIQQKHHHTQSAHYRPNILAETEGFKEKNKHLGFTTREEFIRDAARWRLKFLREDLEYVGIPREKYERLNAAVKDMNTLYYGADDFIHRQVEEVLNQYDKWLEEKEEGHDGNKRIK